MISLQFWNEMNWCFCMNQWSNLNSKNIWCVWFRNIYNDHEIEKWKWSSINDWHHFTTTLMMPLTLTHSIDCIFSSILTPFHITYYILHYLHSAFVHPNVLILNQIRNYFSIHSMGNRTEQSWTELNRIEQSWTEQNWTSKIVVSKWTIRCSCTYEKCASQVEFNAFNFMGFIVEFNVWQMNPYYLWINDQTNNAECEYVYVWEWM